MAEMKKSKVITPLLLHTGQHYDYSMSESFFKELGIPSPDVHLNVGSASHAKQVSLIMQKFDQFCDKYQPDMVVVVGDVNSTMACSLVAVKRGIKVAHIEAGIRSWDRRMPEEVNRIVTDSISDYFFPPSQDAVENLLHEGHDQKDIFLVGNIMIDTLKQQQLPIDSSDVLEKLDLEPRKYTLLTLHRPSNVDHAENLRNITESIGHIQKQMKVVFPVHPRTHTRFQEFGIEKELDAMKNLIRIAPLGYFEFGKLVKNASFVLTDSGGIQEETTVYGVPCITLRENTERPITVSKGTNELAGADKTKIIELSEKIISGNWKKGSVPPMWDGETALRIVTELEKLEIG